MHTKRGKHIIWPQYLHILCEGYFEDLKNEISNKIKDDGSNFKIMVEVILI